MTRLLLPLAAMLMLGGAAHAHDYTLGALKIGHPAIPQPMTRAMTAAGYLSIKNEGAEADRLLSVASDIAARTEVHTTDHGSDGSAKMRHIEALDIPAGETVTFEHGGYHVMFMGLSQGLTEGELHKATLVFEKAGAVEVEFKVEAPAHTKGDSHKHH